MFDEFNIPKQHAPEHAHQSSDIQDAKKNNLDMAADAAYCKFLPIYICRLQIHIWDTTLFTMK